MHLAHTTDQGGNRLIPKQSLIQYMVIKFSLISLYYIIIHTPVIGVVRGGRAITVGALLSSSLDSETSMESRASQAPNS